MPNISVAEMTSAAAKAAAATRAPSPRCSTRCGAASIFSQRGGALVYGGQAAEDGDPDILPSESRASPK